MAVDGVPFPSLLRWRWPFCFQRLSTKLWANAFWGQTFVFFAFLWDLVLDKMWEKRLPPRSNFEVFRRVIFFSYRDFLWKQFRAKSFQTGKGQKWPRGAGSNRRTTTVTMVAAKLVQKRSAVEGQVFSEEFWEECWRTSQRLPRQYFLSGAYPWGGRGRVEETFA